MYSPCLKDVARVAKVSKSTAQRAMSDDPRCAIETRLRVRKIAEEMGYRPKPIFSAMGARNERKRQDGPMLAYVTWVDPNTSKDGAARFDLVGERADELGYGLEHFNLEEWERPEQIWKILYARGFAGIVLDGVHALHLPFFMQNELFPLVCCGRIDPMPFHTVRPDVMKSLHQLWQRLVDAGYRRIGAAICRHDRPLEDDFSRHAAVLGCQKEIDAESAVPPFLGPINDREAFIAWVKAHKPDVVIGFHCGHYYALLEAGYSIPGEISFVSLHADRRQPFISGIDQNREMICRAAVDYLDQLIRRGERGVPEYPVNMIIESLWVEGNSLGQA